MPNTLAYIVLFSWPAVVWLLFRLRPPAEALAWAVIGGYLMIPTRVGVDFPMIPTLDKDLIPSLAAGLFIIGAIKREKVQAAFASRRGAKNENGPELARIQSQGGIAIKLLIGLIVVSPFLTGITNGEPLTYGTANLPGIRIYDSFSMVLSSLVMILPFLLARRYLATPKAHAVLLMVLVLAGLLYSLPALFEVRMSPQLNVWVYGFFPHSFAQQIRDGGFRPVVFLLHGLRVSLFFALTVFAALATWRTRQGQARAGYLAAALWLLMTLVLSKSLGALATTLLLIPVALLVKVRGQLFVSALVAAIILSYPMLRGASLIPVDTVHELAQSISEERAISLQTRLINEDRLLAKANLKPAFGWGGWGRSRVFDTETGQDISTVDGYWVILIGVNGWLGYLALFGLQTLPIFLLSRNWQKLQISLATSGLAIVLVVNLVDLIPNSGITPVTWLIAGALAGRCELSPVLATLAKAPVGRRKRAAVEEEPQAASQSEDAGSPARPTTSRRPVRRYSRDLKN